MLIRGVDLIKTCPLLFLIYILLSLTLLPVGMAVDTGWQNPSDFDDIDGWFSFEPDAYTSNNFYAQMGMVTGTEKQECHWFDYNFNIPEGATITEVWLGAEHYSGHPDDSTDVRLSWNNGVDFTDWHFLPVQQFEVFWTEPFILDRNWSYSEFNNGNFRASLAVDIYATGCYHPDSEVGMYEDKTINFDMTVKRIADVKKGDILLGYDLATGEYIPNLMLADANILKGNFTFYRIIAEYPMKYWDKEIYAWSNPKEVGFKDVCVTPEQRLYTLEKGLIRADQVEVGMSFHGLFRQEGRMVIVPVPITKIETFKGNIAVVLEAESNVFFTHYLMGRIVKTYFLDWLTVKVVYTPPPVCGVPCLFVGMCFVVGLAGFVIWASKGKKQ